MGIGTKNPIRSLHINPTTFQYSSEIVMEVPAYASNYRKWNMVVDAI